MKWDWAGIDAQGERKEEEDEIREAGLDLVQSEREVYNDSHLVVMDSETAVHYMAYWDGHDR